MGKKGIELSYEISESIIDKVIKDFDTNEKEKEDVLRCLFSLYEKNTSLNCVLIKVTVLNSLYSAGLTNNIGKKKVDVVKMAEHIAGEKCFDDWLWSDNQDEQLKAYDYISLGIREQSNGLYDNCYAFASKYCNWHRPDVFPIMDSNAKWNLYSFIKNNDIPFKRTPNNWEKIKVCYDYKLFWNIFKLFQEYLNNDFNSVKKYSVKDIDKFLWQYGRSEDDNSTIQEIGGEGGDEYAKDS